MKPYHKNVNIDVMLIFVLLVTAYGNIGLDLNWLS